MDRRHHDVLQRGLVREQVVLLEHHADLAAQRELVELGIIDLLALDQDRAFVDRHQRVDAAEQRGFARAGRADDADHLALRHVHGDALEHGEAAERLVHVGKTHQRLIRRPHHHFTWKRCSSASVARAIG
jgi:hypothetical protein